MQWQEWTEAEREKLEAGRSGKWLLQQLREEVTVTWTKATAVKMKRSHGFENFWGGSLSGVLISLLGDLAAKLWVPWFWQWTFCLVSGVSLFLGLWLFLHPLSSSALFSYFCLIAEALLPPDSLPWSSWRIWSPLLHSYVSCPCPYREDASYLDLHCFLIPWTETSVEFHDLPLRLSFFASSYVFQGMNLVPNPTFQFTWIFCRYLKCAESISNYNKSKE